MQSPVGVVCANGGVLSLERVFSYPAGVGSVRVVGAGTWG